MRAFWLDRGWYIAMWLVVNAVLITSASLFANRVVRSQREEADRIIAAIERHSGCK